MAVGRGDKGNLWDGRGKVSDLSDSVVIVLIVRCFRVCRLWSSVWR